ncbi:carbon-phosphorus lyase complex subunit PhnI [Gymnodinialimonas sp. 2305UL16-5]|uniref:carbon-phosphorus lyase complex subunit PhnI n=1 Tax=Gymnodinialimonas mytili TaxID=3126503 RepID=UPI00309DD0BA
MYVALKGGEAAIDNVHAWLAEERRGDPAVSELSVPQIREQLSLAVDRVMAEGSLHDPEIAALALKQARGDMIEAIFLVRAYRTTLLRFGPSAPIDTGKMACDRRISATHRDLPGGQVLGPTFDHTHRLLDFALAAKGLERPDAPERPLRLQAWSRGDERFVLSMAYSTQRGYGRNHPFFGELRTGTVAVEMDIPELGFAIEIGEAVVTECETVNPFTGLGNEPAHFTHGCGLVFGRCERKAISTALVDRAMRWKESGEDDVSAPAQDEEFVLCHSDNVQASGFLEHIKLPHYVDFQSELEVIRRLRAEAAGGRKAEAAE